MPSPDRVASLRRFVRFNNRLAAALRPNVGGSVLSLAEAQLLLELSERRARGQVQDSVAALSDAIAMPRNQVAPILVRLENRGLITHASRATDKNPLVPRLTEAGAAIIAPIDAQVTEAAAAALGRIPETAQAEAVAAMVQLEALLDAREPPRVTLDPPVAGDIGWVIARHGALYAAEYGWDARFEAQVARIAADFVETHDPRREAAWIARRAGINVGSVFVVRESDTLARLRLLLVEPSARGSGLGRLLVRQCLGFARQVGYRRMTLWTHRPLVAARHIYAGEGFRLIAKRPHADFGVPLLGEDWEQDL